MMQQAAVAVTSRCKPKTNLTWEFESKARHTPTYTATCVIRPKQNSVQVFLIVHIRTCDAQKNDRHKRQNSLTSLPDSFGQQLEFASQ